MPAPAIHAILARSERLTLLAGLLALTSLSWLYLARVADGMNAMTGNGGSARYMWLMLMGRWGPTQMALAFGMWVVMMVAMMMPSAAPMLFAFVRLGRTRPGPGSPRAIVAVFLLGYVLAWTIFSALATAAQWVLHESDVLTDAMVSTNRALDATLLLGAGIYQFLPLKTACLSKCRTPMGFLVTEWRDGWSGAVVMGFRHGAFCVGCCWALMALLFVVGVMNLLWISALAIAVLVEKLLPFGPEAARLAGIALIAGGLWSLAGP